MLTILPKINDRYPIILAAGMHPSNEGIDYGRVSCDGLDGQIRDSFMSLAPQGWNVSARRNRHKPRNALSSWWPCEREGIRIHERDPLVVT